MKKVYVLDLDGTLINSTRRHYTLMGELLRKKGIELNADEYMIYKRAGNSSLSYLLDVLKLPEHVAYDVNRDWINKIEKAEYMSMDRLYPDTMHFVQTIIKRGESMIFLSARHNKGNTIRMLELLGLAPFTDGVIIVEPGNVYDNKINAIKMIMSKNMTPVIIGDMENEYKIGKELNLETYIVNRGFRSKEYLDKLGIESYENLEEIEKVIWQEA